MQITMADINQMIPNVWLSAISLRHIDLSNLFGYKNNSDCTLVFIGGGEQRYFRNPLQWLFTQIKSKACFLHNEGPWDRIINRGE